MNDINWARINKRAMSGKLGVMWQGPNERARAKDASVRAARRPRYPTPAWNYVAMLPKRKPAPQEPSEELVKARERGRVRRERLARRRETLRLKRLRKKHGGHR